MTDSMVQRVAQAMVGAHRKPTALELITARVAIRAMREPTEAMVKGSDWVCPMYDDPIPSPTECYQAMIDAALDENGS